MSGQGLMCVWQAVAVQDPAHSAVKGVARKNIVQNITSGLANSNGVHYTARSFDDNFPNVHVDFGDFCNYVKVCLRDHSVPLFSVEDLIDAHSWDCCRDAYRLHNCSVDEDEAFKLWQIFNRLCVRGSMPPVMEGEDVQWLGQKLAKHLRKEFETDMHRQYIFVEMLSEIDNACFKSVSPAEVEQAIRGIHSWLVHEICMTGWMSKRTRKQGNWTNWHRRWFILRPGQLTYYTTQTLTERKGDISISDISIVDNLPDYKSLVRRYPARFRITNAPHVEIELSSDDDRTKRVWMVAVREAIEASKAGVSPVQAMLADRHKQRKFGQKLISLDEARTRISALPTAHVITPGLRLGSDAEEEDEDDIDGQPRLEQTRAETMEAVAAETGAVDQDGMDTLRVTPDDHNKYETQRESFRRAFSEIDQTNKGSIDEQEFNIFLQKLGTNMSEQEAEEIFHAIDKSDSGEITLDNFNRFLINSIFGEETTDATSSPQLRAALLKADQDGSGTLAFREFVEYIWEKRWLFCGDRLLTAIEKLEESNRGHQFQEFKSFVDQQHLQKTYTETDENDHYDMSVEGMLCERYSSELDRLAAYLWRRWSAFVIYKQLKDAKDFNRVCKKNNVLIAKLNFVDLVCFSDLPYITPKYTLVRDFAWMKSSEEDSEGKALFPPNFDGVLPVEFATAEYLRYYGASVADKTQKQVSLLYRHSIQDFTYQNLHIEEYVATKSGGSGLRRREFAQLVSPLEDHSGFLVLGKIDEDGELHLTAFKVPARYTLCIPGGTIHSHDYLHGMWQTTLSPESNIDHVNIMRRLGQDNDENCKKFIFAFEQYI